MRSVARRASRWLAAHGHTLVAWSAYGFALVAFTALAFDDFPITSTATASELTFTALCAFATYFSIRATGRFHRSLDSLRDSGINGDRRLVAAVSWEWSVARTARLVLFVLLGILAMLPPVYVAGLPISRLVLAAFLILAGLDALNTWRQEQMRRAFDRRVEREVERLGPS